MRRKKLAFILGIRPDLIRASLMLRYLKEDKLVKTIFIWSGQHYSENLKDIFIQELKVPRPDIELDCNGETDAEIVSKLIVNLYRVLNSLKPDVTVFLGDTNTTVGCLAAAQLNIPIVHVEGGMRSYDWRMPEEKNRTVIDHLSDLIYVYLDEYKTQAVREGINSKNIVVVGNPIVDVLNQYYYKNIKFKRLASHSFFSRRGISKNNYYLMTFHRRENLQDLKIFQAVLDLLSQLPYPIFFPASYRTQDILKTNKIRLGNQFIMVDPIGYHDFLTLLVNSRAVLTDSGTVVEEACILGVPSLQIRHSTERPQTYDVGSSVKLDPVSLNHYPPKVIFQKLDHLRRCTWKHNFGDGKTSKRIVSDLVKKLLNGQLKGHLPENYHFPIKRSFREDNLKVKWL
ncbi:UDP-N-acetylglucosamine 2-epimerase [Candidatus Woesebacteria bacterium RIFCSPLOWO2_01_FULL_39_10b]|uniref:UDP-N-acetylglucosamine 2-epimerase n=1 Tax=Candidatus Woesebacteria bacterium RIFCSPLOWO2_01_FULL_39_10b TaxID=1802517 RepID=A0A1F8B5S8_9BACT|nr:MAG: UDP-N-acetylglucosamine 2-epimerase [Candidatus Woesebacteria bacterium RIFCSPLOWO2_01_FULL_39_10b]